MKIGIAGFGFVGQAVYGSLTCEDTVIYDKYKDMNTFRDLVECTHIFCCLPTNMLDDGKQDFDAYDDFFDTLIGYKYKGILIVKSTCLYSNIKPYEEKLNIVFNPEFLNQNSAVNDFAEQEVIVLGGRMDHCKSVTDVYYSQFNLSDEIQFEYCSIKEATELKYIHNIYHAYKVLFWNYAQQLTGNSRKMSYLYSKITGNTNEMSRICADGRPGYGGACFVKDVNAMRCVAPHKLTDYMYKYNHELREDRP